MKENKYEICVLGGGIAGLSAAVFANEAGFKVELIEEKPRLGGRAYSFYDKVSERVIDNGQHILASWYNETKNFLSLIGTIDKLKTVNGLNIKFYDLNSKGYELECPNLPPPYHLIWGILTFNALSFKDKFSLLRLINSIKKGKFKDDELKKMSVDELFEKTKQPQNIKNKFWIPFIAAVFNSTIECTSAYLFKNIIVIGFIKKNGSDLVLPDVCLNELYVNPSEDYLQKNNCQIQKGTKIKKLFFEDKNLKYLIKDTGEKLYYDYYISTIPFFEFELLNENLELQGLDNIKPSAIINIHIIFEENISDVFKDDFAGIYEATIQWVFKVSSDHICVVISAAGELSELSMSELYEVIVHELSRVFPEFINKKVKSYRVIKEMRATFVPDNETNNNRPSSRTEIKNLFLAGDWTNTGLPCTIESAVLSSKKCVQLILESVN